jgi:hypothetical protein
MGFDAPTMANNVNINVNTLRNGESFMLGDVGMESTCGGESGQVPRRIQNVTDECLVRKLGARCSADFEQLSAVKFHPELSTNQSFWLPHFVALCCGHATTPPQARQGSSNLAKLRSRGFPTTIHHFSGFASSRDKEWG